MGMKKIDSFPFARNSASLPSFLGYTSLVQSMPLHPGEKLGQHEIMRQHKIAIALAAFVALTGTLVSSGLAQTNAPRSRPPERTETKGFSDAGKAALSRQLSDAVSRGDTPGVVALVVGRDGVLYEGAAGKLDVAHDIAMPVNAIFSIASMTKPVTSVAIMMLFEEGKLKLDDPVSKYLAGFDNLQVITKFNEKDATYETRPAKRPMTIRHLLTHTSGIGYGFTNPIEYRLTEATKKDEWELPLLNDPGDKWNYSASTARARHDRRENHRRVARSLLPAAHLQTAGHGGYVVRRAARQAVARGDAVQPRKRHVAGAAASDPSRRRRRRRSAAMAASTRPSRITASSCRCCSTAGTWAPRKS